MISAVGSTSAGLIISSTFFSFYVWVSGEGEEGWSCPRSTRRSLCIWSRPTNFPVPIDVTYCK